MYLTYDPFYNINRETKLKKLKLKSKTKLSDVEINTKYFFQSKLYLTLLKDLNDIQLKVVLNTNGSIYCSAVPGAGKTKTLVYKVTYLIEHCNVKPNKILVITFTKKASHEVRDRIEYIVNQNHTERIVSGTFHSVCHKFLREYGIINNTVILDSDKQKIIIEEILKNIISEKNIPENEKLAKNKSYEIITEIASAKNKLKNAYEYSKSTTDLLNIEIYNKYEKYLIDHNYCDYDDLLVKMIYMIRLNKKIKKDLENKFEYVFVDEFQDTNSLQFEIISCFANKTKNITVVGDTDQSIFGWRFADSKIIEKFNMTFPNHIKYCLDQNYRSTQNIINCSNSVICQDKNRINTKIWTHNNEGDKVTLYETNDLNTEAKYITDCILKLNNEQKISFGNIAVLIRMNRQSRIFEELFTKAKIPFDMIGSYDFYNSDEIQDILSYLKFIINKKDIISFKRIIDVNGDDRNIITNELDEKGWKTFISDKIDVRIKSFVKIIKECDKMKNNNKFPTEIIEYILKKINYCKYFEEQYDTENLHERIENVKELLNASQKYETIDSFLIDIMLTSESCNKNIGSKVSITTIHASKGLEWDVVFIPSIVENIIPSYLSISSIDSKEQINEERRLLYVAMTRAKLKLFLSYSKTIKSYRNTEVVKISRFLNDLPKESIVFIN